MLWFSWKAEAVSPNPPWCHCEPNGNCQTIFLPQQALINAGHVNAQGNPLHAGDHAGECIEPSNTPVPPTPTIGEPTVTPIIPSPTSNPCDGDCQNEPSVTPIPTSILESPSPTVILVHQDTPVSQTDHNSAGSSTPPSCTVEVPKVASNPQYSKSNGAVVITWVHDGTNISKWSLNYGYDKDNMFMGIPYLEKNAREVTLNGLQNRTTWVAICGYNGDSCQSCKIFDP